MGRDGGRDMDRGGCGSAAPTPSRAAPPCLASLAVPKADGLGLLLCARALELARALGRLDAREGRCAGRVIRRELEAGAGAFLAEWHGLHDAARPLLADACASLLAARAVQAVEELRARRRQRVRRAA